MPPDEIMTLEEVARYLKLKPQTVYKWAQEGQIPGAKLGKEWRFRRGILDEWIDSSIILSKGGLDLLVRSGQVAVQNQGLSMEELDGLLKDSMTAPPQTSAGSADSSQVGTP
jgi:excisionase family DNA binding protein